MQAIVAHRNLGIRLMRRTLTRFLPIDFSQYVLRATLLTG
jgi:hypothetical protein